jgi:hypothetical protein
MTTPQWTVKSDEWGGLLYWDGDEDDGIDVGEAFVHLDPDDPFVAAARAALVADVAAARLVPDLEEVARMIPALVAERDLARDEAKAAARLVDDMKAKLANSVEVTVGGMGTVHALGPPECVEVVRQAVAKARLVDDMAAVVRRYEKAAELAAKPGFAEGIRASIHDRFIPGGGAEWRGAVCATLDDLLALLTPDGSPGEVAALHHARRQKNETVTLFNTFALLSDGRTTKVEPLSNTIIDDPDGTRDSPHRYKSLGENVSDGFCRRCGRDSRHEIHGPF